MLTQKSALSFARERIEDIELVTNMTPLKRSVLRLGLTCVDNDMDDLNMNLPPDLALRFDDAGRRVGGRLND